MTSHNKLSAMEQTSNCCSVGVVVATSSQLTEFGPVPHVKEDVALTNPLNKETAQKHNKLTHCNIPLVARGLYLAGEFAQPP